MALKRRLPGGEVYKCFWVMANGEKSNIRKVRLIIWGLNIISFFLGSHVNWKRIYDRYLKMDKEYDLGLIKLAGHCSLETMYQTSDSIIPYFPSNMEVFGECCEGT